MISLRIDGSMHRPCVAPHFRKMAARAVVMAILPLLSVVAISHPAAASEYVLGPQDKVRLKVYEWHPSQDTVFQWTALNDTFTVGPDGALSLPFAGTVKAMGLTAEQLGGQIGNRMMTQMGLGAAPDTSVEIVQFRPFYIVGYVTHPGEFPYRPDLTVLQALSIAGGLRTTEEGLTRLEREVITGQGEVNVLALGTLGLVARKARLEAESSGADQIAFPQLLTSRQDQSPIALLMNQEKAIFDARRQGLDTQIKALDNLAVSLKEELTSLQGQLVLHDRQIDLIQKELTSVSSLVTKGYAAAPREISLERELAQFQSTRLAAETSLLRSRQEISRTDISILDLRNRYKNEVTVALRDTQAQLDEIGRKTDTARQLLHESETFGPRLLALHAQTSEREPVYKIVRPGQNGATELPATEGTVIQPGDTIKVTMPPIPGEAYLDMSSSGAASDDSSAAVGVAASTN